jgi:hypothetical protein
MCAVCVIPSVSKSGTREGDSSAFTACSSISALEKVSYYSRIRMKSKKQRQVFHEINETKIFLINFMLQICTKTTIRCFRGVNASQRVSQLHAEKMERHIFLLFTTSSITSLRIPWTFKRGKMTRLPDPSRRSSAPARRSLLAHTIASRE